MLLLAADAQLVRYTFEFVAVEGEFAASGGEQVDLGERRRRRHIEFEKLALQPRHVEAFTVVVHHGVSFVQ